MTAAGMENVTRAVPTPWLTPGGRRWTRSRHFIVYLGHHMDMHLTTVVTLADMLNIEGIRGIGSPASFVGALHSGMMRLSMIMDPAVLGLNRVACCGGTACLGRLMIIYAGSIVVESWVAMQLVVKVAVRSGAWNGGTWGELARSPTRPTVLLLSAVMPLPDLADLPAPAAAERHRGHRLRLLRCLRMEAPLAAALSITTCGRPSGCTCPLRGYSAVISTSSRSRT